MTEQKAKVDVSDLQNGPLENRQCRDVFCCLLFIANIAAMVYCSYYAYTQGIPNLVFRGTDVDLNICGKPNTTTADYPYLYFPKPTSFAKNDRVCVKACPKFTSGTTLDALQCIPNTNIVDCNYQFIVDVTGGSAAAGAGTTGNYGYETTVIIDRVCLPTTAVFTYINGQNTTSSTDLSSALSGGYLANLMQDISNNWYILLGGFGAAIIISFIFMFLLRCLAGCIVWLSIFGLIGSLVGLGVLFCYSGGLFGDVNVSYFGYTVPKIAADQQYVRYYGFTLWAVAGVLLIILLCLCNRIRLAVGVCKCAGRFIVEVCSAMSVPIWMTLVTVILWAVCAVVMIYLVSAASFVANGDVFTSIVDYTQTNLIRFYYFVFGTLWSNALVQALTTFVISSACCMWYFNQGAGSELHLPVLRSYGRAFRYHFGSLAFGSLLLAIIQFMQLMVEAFKKQAENSGADRNKVLEYIINCLRCCLACVERIVQFINKNAYIQIALRGKNFCMAAKDGFELVWSNPLRYAIVGGIGEIIMFLGKLMIAIGTTLAMYAYLTYASNTVMGKMLFLVLVFIFSYAVGVVFMTVYSLAMDTILVCFIVDQTNQKERGGKGSIRAPDELVDLIDNQDK